MNEEIVDDAIVLHDTLNPALWDLNGDMKPEVREALLAMAAEFEDFLGVEGLDIIDITVSGSNAAYSYTPHSDVDLHLVVRIPVAMDTLYKELFDAKKNLYNITHNQTIKGFDVEFYVQDVTEPVKSLGIYSVLKGTWNLVPRRVSTNIDDTAVELKVQAYTERIFEALRRRDLDFAKKTWDAIKTMRKAGLEKAGEFGAENLAYKVLRTRGLTDQLFNLIMELQDAQLSLESKQ